MIDTHAHLYSSRYGVDATEMIVRAKEAGVIKVLLPNIDSQSEVAMHSLEASDPTFLFAMMGVHPCSIKATDYILELDTAARCLAQRPYIAVGEIGIDLYWEKDTLKIQTEAFITQLQWAMQLGVPVSIHAREANEACLRVVEKLQDGRLTGVFHCFSGTIEQGKRMIDLGFYLGIGGVVTYPKGGLDTVLPELPLDRLVLETDAPFLTPVPFRGKLNESAYLEPIAQKLSQLMGVSPKELKETTTRNAENVFSTMSIPSSFAS